MLTRRQFLISSAMVGAGLAMPRKMGLWNVRRAFAQPLNGSLDPAVIQKYQMPLVIPPALPKTKLLKNGKNKIDYYEIAVRQFQQQILPPGLPMTTVWSYGSVQFPGTVAQGGTFNYPAFTIEAKHNQAVQVKWVNDLIDANGNYLPHLLPVDQTLHWANPPGGAAGRDMHGTSHDFYTGPVPIVTHVHGAHTYEQFDGYPEAWYLPAAQNTPAGFATTGTFYDYFVDQHGLNWSPGTATFTYPNDQRATTLWYHDHTLGMTRLNVYAGPAGFYLIRGGPDDMIMDIKGNNAILPGPAPDSGADPFGTYYEVPIVIQDRAFNGDGSLFYPDNRAFFEGLDPDDFDPNFPFWGDPACDGPSDVAPIWQPEYFGNVMVVNGFSWPYLEVERRRYRFRFLNGCNSRFLILKMSNDMPFYQIGADGGFLPAPAQLTELLMAPAERADVIVDFSNLQPGTEIILQNLGPDEPFGGGTPGVDFAQADPNTTGQVMQFRVAGRKGNDPSTPPMDLVLPAVTAPASPNGPYANLRQVSLNEEESKTVLVLQNADESWVTPVALACDHPEAVPFGPTAALLGTLNPDGSGKPLKWTDPEGITETPTVDTTETWEIHNFTADAHPIHIHLVQFQVVGREDATTGVVRGPEAGETGFKDTVIAYPGEITRVQAQFDIAGRYVWHCHIVEHEDNEMMRPYQVGS